MGTKGNSNLPWKIPDTYGQMKRILGSSEFKDLPNSWGNNIRVLVCFNMSEHQQFSNTHKLLLLQASGFEASQLDHNDPSKPSHCLTNGPEPSKPLKAMVATSKSHRKTIDGNGQTAQKTFNGDGLLKNH